MKHTALKRLLALTMAIVMVMSLGVTGVSAEERGRQVLGYEKLGADDVSAQLMDTEDGVNETSPEYYADDEMVRVTIVMETQPAIVAMDGSHSLEELRAARRVEQKKVEKAISASALDGEALDTVWNLTLVTNAISANVEYGRIEKIKQVDGVAAVILETKYMPLGDAETSNIVSQTMTGADTAQASGYTGAGTRIAVIDTGIDTDHQSFAAAPFDYAIGQLGGSYDLLDTDEISSVMSQLHAYEFYAYDSNGNQTGNDELTADDVYISSKIPFGFNYIDRNLDVTHDNDTQGSHGSHVAGIAAANRYIAAERIFDADGIYDFDGDRDMDADDAQALMDYIICGTKIDNLENADLSGDGAVTDYDVHLLLDKLAQNFVSAADSVGVTGVAPDAQIVALKVFGQGGGAYQSDYTAAIEDAIVLGCDSINLSLGASYPGFSHSYTYKWYDEVIENLENTGVVVCISAGNAYNWADYDGAYQLMYTDEGGTATTSDPATYSNTLGVASAENIGSVTDIETVFRNNGGEVTLTFSAESVSSGVNASWGTLDPEYTGATCEAVFLGDPTALLTGGEQTDMRIYAGSVDDFSGYDFTGKIVFVARGNQVNFADKHMNAAAAGAAAVVIYNNVDGMVYASLEGSTATIPCGAMSLAQAQQIYALCTNSNGVYSGSFFVKRGLNVDWGTKDAPISMSDFSSWGAIGDLSIKPEVTAPGGGIYSVNGVDKSGSAYETMSGTSMASPHAAGIAALASQYIQESGLAEEGVATRRLVHSLMMSTAEPIIEADTGVEYSVRNQGAGLVNIQNIIAAQSHIMVSGQEDGKVKAELGDGTQPRSFTFTVYNHSASATTFDLSASILTTGTTTRDGHSLATSGMTKLNADVTFSTGSSVTVPAKGSADVTVTIDIPHSTVLKMLELGYENGFYIEGFVYAVPETDAEGVQDVTHSIPLLGWYGSWTDISMYDTGSYIEQYYNTQERPSHLSDKIIAVDGDGYEVNTMMKNMLAWTYSDYEYPYAYSGNIYNNGVTDSGELGGDATYIEARNAINTTSARNWEIYGVFPTLIRNAIDADLFITNNSTNEVVYREDCEGFAMYGSFYYSPQFWFDLTTSTGITVDNWDWAADLPEGTKLTVSLGMVPEYYADDDRYFDSFEYDESYGAEIFYGYEIDDNWWMDGTVGDGAFLNFSFAVDNTAPDLAAVEAPLTLEGNKLNFSVQDNRYIAAVILIDGNGRTPISYYYPDMAEDEIGQVVNGSFDLSDYQKTYGNRAVIAICDYAGNETYYAVNLDGIGESYGDFVAFQYGDGWTNPQYSWASFTTDVNKDEYALYTDVIPMAAAEYINGYIIAQDNNGKLYGIDYEDFLSGAISDLETTYITTLENVYQDFAYSYAEGKLYGVVISTYEGYPTTEILSIDINGTYAEESEVSRGGLYGLAMAIDDEGTVYVMGPSYDWDTEEVGEIAHLWSVGLEENEWTHQWQLGWRLTDLGDTGLKMDYRQSMTWDHNNDKLYWAQYFATGWLNQEMALYEVTVEDGDDGTAVTCNKVGRLSTETCALIAPLTAETAADGKHNNVPAFDTTEIGQPILSSGSLSMGKNTTQTLSVRFNPWYSGRTALVWSSSDESIATVDQNGVVTAVSDGNCTITVANAEDETKFDTCEIVVASLSVEVEGIISQATTNILTAGNSHYYAFTMDEGSAAMTHGLPLTANEEINFGLDISAAVLGRDGYIWASEWGNNGMFYKIDPNTMEAIEVYEPVGGGHTYGMSYSANTDKFTTIMNYELFVDLGLDDAMYDEMIGMSLRGEDFSAYHRINMSAYLAASDEGFGTGESDYGSIVDVVFCGITDIDEPYTYEHNYRDYLGEWDYSMSGYTSTTTHVLLDNVGRLWYIDEIPNLNVYKDDWGNVAYYTGDNYEDAMYSETEFFAMGGEYGPSGFFTLEETDENGVTTATGFYIRELQETPLTEMYRNGTMPRYTYNFSDIHYAGKTDEGAPLFFLSLYDFWNESKTNQLYLYVGSAGTGEFGFDESTYTQYEIMTPDALYELGTTGETYVAATITSAKYIAGLPAAADNSTGATEYVARNYVVNNFVTTRR